MEKVLEVLIGANWAPAAFVLSGALIQLAILSACFFSIYRTSGKRVIIKVILAFGGYYYILLSKEFPGTGTIGAVFLYLSTTLIGLFLILMSGMISGASLSEKKKEELLSELE